MAGPDVCAGCSRPLPESETVFFYGDHTLHLACWVRLVRGRANVRDTDPRRPAPPDVLVEQAKRFIEAELRRIAESESPPRP